MKSWRAICPMCSSILAQVVQYGPGSDINREFMCGCGLRLYIGEDAECKGSRKVTIEHVVWEIETEFQTWKNGGKAKP